MRRRHVGLLAALSAVAAFAACTLNPQPLPPRDDFGGESTGVDASAKADSGSFGTSPEVPGPLDDAATNPVPNGDMEAGSEAGDGGLDEAGDAATDADAG